VHRSDGLRDCITKAAGRRGDGNCLQPVGPGSGLSDRGCRRVRTELDHLETPPARQVGCDRHGQGVVIARWSVSVAGSVITIAVQQ
jgi:hypothetical protein